MSNNLHEKTIELLAGFGDRFLCPECSGTGEVTKIVRHPNGERMAVSKKCKECQETGGYDEIVYWSFYNNLLFHRLSNNPNVPRVEVAIYLQGLDHFICKLEAGEK